MLRRDLLWSREALTLNLKAVECKRRSAPALLMKGVLRDLRVFAVVSSLDYEMPCADWAPPNPLPSQQQPTLSQTVGRTRQPALPLNAGADSHSRDTASKRSAGGSKVWNSRFVARTMTLTWGITRQELWEKNIRAVKIESILRMRA